MTKEFEGRTEQEAVSKAVEELKIDSKNFDVEVIDNGHRGLFRKANVKIRVHFELPEEEETPVFSDAGDDSDFDDNEEDLEVDADLEAKICEFLEGTVSHMGYSCKAEVTSRRGRKICINLSSDDSSSIIIGRKGKNLDALQVLANVFTGKFDSERKIIVDSEGYRVRHEEQIIKEAFRMAQQVRKTGRSRLLEPMNPYERRLVHSALNDVTGIETKSEGDGLIKQVRIISTKH